MSDITPPRREPAGNFVWSDEYLLGFEPMDATHKEFVDAVHALETAPDADLPGLMERFIAHAEDHFGQELAWMSMNGFPAKDCHVEEHDKVLASAYQVRTLVAAGDFDVARSFAQALKDWFPGHADYLDSALAKWMVKQNTGGSPVVLRRNINTGAASQASLPGGEGTT